MGTTYDFTTSFLHFSLFSTVLLDLAKSKPVHSLMLPSHLFFCLPCLLLPFTVPCKMVWAKPDEREICSYHCSLRLFTMVIRSPCGPIACWILERTSYEHTYSGKLLEKYVKAEHGILNHTSLLHFAYHLWFPPPKKKKKNHSLQYAPKM